MDYEIAARQKARQAVRDFVEGAESGDLQRMWDSFGNLDCAQHDGGGWRRAFRAISRIQVIPDQVREFFPIVFLKYGARIRQEVSDDLIYASGLRALLPPYRGTAMQLYRGTGAVNRKHKTYGLSWSSTREVARAFAETGHCRCTKGGSVLLATIAPPEAIICAPALISDNYDEQEFIIDRRFLGKVLVEERFPQLTDEELHILNKQVATVGKTVPAQTK